MKKYLFLILSIWFSVITQMVAENTQRIQVLQYVPDREGGIHSTNIHKRPLPGVEIEISGAEPVKCDRIGCATVHFTHLQVGDHVYIKEISKPGFELFSLNVRESWHVPETNHEMQQILMISKDDMKWIEDQWRGVVTDRTGLRFGYYSVEDHLLTTDMSELTSLQKTILPLVLAGEYDEVIKIFMERNLLENYKNSFEGDPKALEELEEDLEFMLQMEAIRFGFSDANGYNLINSLLSFNIDIPWLIKYYPDYCHALRKTEEFDAYAEKRLTSKLSAADRAYLKFFQQYNHLNDNDIQNALQMELETAQIYDSLAQAVGDEEIYAYDRGVLANAIGTKYFSLNQKEEMDAYFTLARKFFEIAITQDPKLQNTTYPYVAVQAENYWSIQYKTELVDQMIKQSKNFTAMKHSGSDIYRASYLSTLRRFASIYYMRRQYSEAYDLLNEAEKEEERFFKLQPQLRAESYANFLELKARVCYSLSKMHEADVALGKTYTAYDVVDRINPGNYKKKYLDIHLLHAPIRIATEQFHWARADLNRAEALADNLFADDKHQLDSVKNIINDFRNLLKPTMISEEAARLRYNPDRFEFAFITDTHNYGRSADIRDADKNIEAFVEYCNENQALQCAVHGGDFINAYDTDHNRALWCLTRARFQFQGLHLPFYTVKGNHDCNGKQWKDDKEDNTQIVTDREYFDLFSPTAITNPLADPTDIVYNAKEPTRNYYYRDFETQRIRMVFLNAYHRDTMERFGYVGEELRWLAENALDFSKKENPGDWGFIIFGHSVPPNFNRGINRLLYAYAHGEKEVRDTTLNVPFHWSETKQKRAQMIALICGHQHIDIYNNYNGYNHINVTRGFATGNEVKADPLAFSHFIVDRRNHKLIEKRIGAYHSREYSYGEKCEQLSPYPPFAGADGLGQYTTGAGEYGRVIQVTNLNDDGEGSLRWAIAQKGARNITFKKGGVIELLSPLDIENDSITILGQTAPKEVVLKGQQLNIKASEVIVRYLTIEPGLFECNAVQDDHFGQKNIILDHLTVGSTLNSGIAIRYTEDATVQECIIAGSKSDVQPALLAGGFKVTYYHNHINGGARAIKIAEEIGTNRWLHIVRNVIEGWEDYSIYGGANQAEVSITENLFVPKNCTKQFKMLQVGEDGTNRYYVRKNVINGLENKKQLELIADRTGIPWRMPSDLDTVRWNQIPPVARPNPRQYSFSSSCITIAAFHYKEIEGTPSPFFTYQEVTEKAGNRFENRVKRYKDKNKDGIPDQFNTINDWINWLDNQ